MRHYINVDKEGLLKGQSKVGGSMVTNQLTNGRGDLVGTSKGKSLNIFRRAMFGKC